MPYLCDSHHVLEFCQLSALWGPPYLPGAKNYSGRQSIPSIPTGPKRKLVSRFVGRKERPQATEKKRAPGPIISVIESSRVIASTCADLRDHLNIGTNAVRFTRMIESGRSARTLSISPDHLLFVIGFLDLWEAILVR